MVKLLRLKGKLSDNPNGNTEIINNFRQPVLVGRYSKIALVGLDIVLASDHVLLQDSVIRFNGVDITIPAGTYDASEIGELLTSLIGYNAGTIAPTQSSNITVAVDNNERLAFVLDSVAINPTPFASQFDAELGTPIWDDDGSIARDPASAFDLIAKSLVNVPNAGFHLKARLSADHCDEPLDYGVILDIPGEAPQVFAQIEVKAGELNYLVTVGDEEFNTGVPIVPAGADDVVFRIDYSRDEVRFRINAPPNNNLFDQAYPVSFDEWEKYLNSSEGFSRIQVIIPDTSEQSLIDCESTLLGDNPILSSINMSFSTLEIRSYLGFREQPPVTRGVPARLTADDSYGDWVKEPGVMVCIDPFLLDSFDGDSNSTYQPNILYVVHDPEYQNHALRLDVPSPVFLNINNEAEINLSTIRVSFWNTTTGTPKPLVFEKAPIVTLMIEDGEEDNS